MAGVKLVWKDRELSPDFLGGAFSSLERAPSFEGGVFIPVRRGEALEDWVVVVDDASRGVSGLLVGRCLSGMASSGNSSASGASEAGGAGFVFSVAPPSSSPISSNWARRSSSVGRAGIVSIELSSSKQSGALEDEVRYGPVMIYFVFVLAHRGPFIVPSLCQ